MRKMSPGTPEGGPAGAKPGSSILGFAGRHPDAALAIGALVLALGSTAWFLLQSPNFYSGYDYARMHSYYKGFYRASLLAGRAPLWNPYSGLGRPFMADIETATFYPPTLLVLLFGVPAGMALLVLFHQALAIVGGVRLGRFLGASTGASWMLGAGVALSGAFTSRLSVGIVEGYFTLCWFPMLLWLGARLQDGWDPRVAAAFALSVGLAILAGQPPLLYVVFLGLTLFLVFRMDLGPGGMGSRKGWTDLAGLAGAGVLGVGLAAATLLPFFELISQGNRPLHSPDFADANGMPAPSWLSLLVPTSQTFGPNWEYGIHCGLVPVLAAAGGLFFLGDRNVRALVLMGLMGGLMASGDRGPFLRWLMHVFPGVSALRIPSRYGLLVAMAVLGLAAVSLSRRAKGQALLLLPAVAVGIYWILWLGPRTGPNSGAFETACVAAIVGAAVLVGLWHLRGGAGAGAVAVLLGAFCATNWYLGIALQSPVYSQYGFTSAEGQVHESLEARGLLDAGKAPPRVAFNPSDMRENAGMTGGFSTYNSYVAPSLARTWDYVHTASHLKANPNDFINMPYDLGLAPLRWGSINLAASLDRASRTLVYAAHPDPRAYLAFASRRVPDFHAANEAMAEGHDFHKVALVEPGRGPELTGGVDAIGSAEVTSFTPNQVIVHARAPQAGILVLAEAWYPGWSATVGGIPADVFPVNGWMRGTTVPAGESDVVFTFHSRTLGAGLAISAACAALIAGLAAGWTAAKRGA